MFNINLIHLLVMVHLPLEVEMVLLIVGMDSTRRELSKLEDTQHPYPPWHSIATETIWP